MDAGSSVICCSTASSHVGFTHSAISPASSGRPGAGQLNSDSAGGKPRKSWVGRGRAIAVNAVAPMIGRTQVGVAIGRRGHPQGLVLQPSFLVGRHLYIGAFVEVMPQYRAIALGVRPVDSSRKHLTFKVRVLIDFLVEALRVPEGLDSSVARIGPRAWRVSFSAVRPGHA